MAGDLLPRIAASAVAILAGALFLSPPALADGDPASDVLLGSNVFYPYQPQVSVSLEHTLNAETEAAADARFPIKVALIGGPVDLGVVPEMFGKPETYAQFLHQELQLILGPHVILLVVMPQGYGVEGLPRSATAAAASLAKPTGKPNNSLAAAAIIAVQKLAAAAGHPIAGKLDTTDTGSGGGGSSLTVVIVALAAVAIAGGVLLTRRRLARSR